MEKSGSRPCAGGMGVFQPLFFKIIVPKYLRYTHKNIPKIFNLCYITLMQEVFECIFRNGLIPVLTVSDLTGIETYGRFFSLAGFGCLEVTLRTREAAQAIRILKKNFPGLTVGAGTVLNVDEGKKALDAGSDFLVSPGFTVGLLEFCSRNSIPYIPGVQTPVEIQTALEYGFNVLKFFPCEAAGGIRTLKALGAPFHSVGFVPTGGINKENMKKSANNGFTNATDAADYLVKRGVPFRDAHGIVGQVVLYCIDKNIAIDDMSLEELKAISPVFEADVYEAVSMETCVNTRLTIGAPSKSAMDKVIAIEEDYLANCTKIGKKK